MDSMVSHWVSNHWSSMDSMVSHWVSNHWSSMDSVVSNWVSNNWSSMNSVVSNWVSNNWCSLVHRLRMSLSLVAHISDETVLMVSMIGHNLDTAVRKLYSVLSLHNSVLVLSLSLGKVSSIFISTTILVSEWSWWYFFLMVRCRGVVGGRGRGIRGSRGVGSRYNGRGCQCGGEEEGRNDDL